MDDCTRIDDHCELLRESPRQWYLSYNSYCMSFARLCKRQNYRTQESDDKQKKAASNAETVGILLSDFFEVRDSGTHSFALPTLAGVAFVLLDELLHLGGGFGTQSDGG